MLWAVAFMKFRLPPQKSFKRFAVVLGIGVLIFAGIVTTSVAALAATGILRWTGTWTANGFSCDSGHALTLYHYDCGCSNNTTWYACVPDGTYIPGQGSVGGDTYAEPTVALTASPTTITAGAYSTLSWSSTNATQCTSSNFPTGDALSGSANVLPNQTTTYVITCSNQNGSHSASKTVTVNTATPTATLNASPTSVTSGAYSTLSWSSTYTSQCTSSSFPTGNATYGSYAVGPLYTSTTYTIQCTGSYGNVNATRTVNVGGGGGGGGGQHQF